MTSDTPWLTTAEADAWLDVVAVATLLPAALDTQLEHDADLNFFEYFTMVQLAAAPERSLRISDLAAQTHASIPRLSRVVSRLEGQGMISRRPDPADGRGRRAQLTERGLEKLAEAAPGHLRTVRRLFTDVLTAEQASTLSELCRVLLAELDPDRTMLAQTLRSRRRPGLSSAPG